MKKDLPIWNFILDRLKAHQSVMLLLVAESEGSSPGRPGFKMAIGEDGILIGSIGGGIMEVKLVELGRKMLKEAQDVPILKKQIHSKNVSLHQSGMICSGEQTLLYYLITPQQNDTLEKIIVSLGADPSNILQIEYAEGQSSFEVIPLEKSAQRIVFEKRGEQDFIYRENLGFSHRIFIIGGGHCALALSELMAKLDFYIQVIDDRPHLNTLEQNHFAQEKHRIESYDQAGALIPSGHDVYVVVMTLGYRTDIQALLSLKEKQFGYLGVLGSEAKIAAVKEELIKNHFPDSLFKMMHAPVGVKIHSHSPEEIAISIAAEIIGHRNQS